MGSGSTPHVEIIGTRYNTDGLAVRVSLIVTAPADGDGVDIFDFIEQSKFVPKNKKQVVRIQYSITDSSRMTSQIMFRDLDHFNCRNRSWRFVTS